MENHTKKRSIVKGKITRIENAVTAQGATPWDPRSVTSHQQQLDQLWNELVALHDAIGLLCDNEEALVPHQSEFDLMIGRIENVRLRFPAPAASAPSGSGTASAAAANNEATIRLPRLELPTFSGNLHEWTSFHDLFAATINNNDKLAGAQKLQYLKASLKGDAALLIETIQITDDNFKEAWEILEKRYDNKREIINAHMKRLFSQTPSAAESPSSLRKLIDITSETVRALRVLKVPVDHWDIVLSYLVLEKVDPETRRQWELALTTTEVVKFKDVISFLEQRARALLSCGATRPSKAAGVQERSTPPHKAAHQERRNSPTPRQSYHVGIAKEKCRICQEKHAVYHCNELLQSSIENRRQLAKTHALCYNCLSGEHQWTFFKSGGCRKYGGKHHTLLHVNTDQGQRSDSEEQPPVTTHHGHFQKRQS